MQCMGKHIQLLPKKLETLVRKSVKWQQVVQAINDEVMPVYPTYRSCCAPAEDVVTSGIDDKELLEVKRELIESRVTDANADASSSSYTLETDGSAVSSAFQRQPDASTSGQPSHTQPTDNAPIILVPNSSSICINTSSLDFVVEPNPHQMSPQSHVVPYSVSPFTTPSPSPSSPSHSNKSELIPAAGSENESMKAMDVDDDGQEKDLMGEKAEDDDEREEEPEQDEGDLPSPVVRKETVAAQLSCRDNVMGQYRCAQKQEKKQGRVKENKETHQSQKKRLDVTLQFLHQS